MRAIVLCLILVGLSVSDNPIPPRSYVVNLDLPPAERWPWKELALHYNQSVEAALNLIGQFIPWWGQGIVEDLAMEVFPHLGDYGLEVKSGADLLNISVAKATLLNIIYEVEAGCTSIIAQTDSGDILHARNLDFNLAQTLRELVIEVAFQRNGKTVYSGTTYVGYVGLLTGMRKGYFSITANQRQQGYLIENLLEALFVKGTTSACFLIRDTLQDETINTFSKAVDKLSHAPLAAPIYVIVAGTNPGEGSVITRDRNGPADIWTLNATEGRWFEVQTNWDHWEPSGDTRLQTAVNGMKSVGRDHISLNGIMKVLSTPLVLNSDTTYTTLMSPKYGNFTTFIRNE